MPCITNAAEMFFYFYFQSIGGPYGIRCITADFSRLSKMKRLGCLSTSGIFSLGQMGLGAALPSDYSTHGATRTLCRNFPPREVRAIPQNQLRFSKPADSDWPFGV